MFVSLKPEIYLNIISKFSFFLTENIVSITKTRWFMLCSEIITGYSENYKKA